MLSSFSLSHTLSTSIISYNVPSFQIYNRWNLAMARFPKKCCIFFLIASCHTLFHSFTSSLYNFGYEQVRLSYHSPYLFSGSAILKASRSLIPNPPLSLVSVILFQAIQCIPFSFSPLLHQNLVVIFVISLHTPFAILNQDILYSGIACAMNFSITSLPVSLRIFFSSC